ncbi:MAG: hypothetical protein ACFB51_01095, partial [Anaerolineae bacterium]
DIIRGALHFLYPDLGIIISFSELFIPGNVDISSGTGTVTLCLDETVWRQDYNGYRNISIRSPYSLNKILAVLSAHQEENSKSFSRVFSVSSSQFANLLLQDADECLDGRFSFD